MGYNRIWPTTKATGLLTILFSQMSILIIIDNQVLNKTRIVVKILSQKGRI